MIKQKKTSGYKQKENENESLITRIQGIDEWIENNAASSPSSAQQKLQWQNLGFRVTGEMSRAYLALTASLLLNQPVSQSQREFMDRYERLLEYFKPKLARSELTGEDGSPVIIKVVNYSEGIIQDSSLQPRQEQKDMNIAKDIKESL